MINDISSLKELSLAEQFARVSRLWKMVADRELAPLGLTHPRWCKKNQHMNKTEVRDLAEFFGIKLDPNQEK